MLLLEPSLDPEESDKTVENRIWTARRVLDLLFHADKGFVSKDVSILVKQKLNAAYEILCSKNFRKIYCDLLTKYNYKTCQNAYDNLVKYSKETIKTHIQNHSESLKQNMK